MTQGVVARTSPKGAQGAAKRVFSTAWRVNLSRRGEIRDPIALEDGRSISQGRIEAKKLLDQTFPNRITAHVGRYSDLP